jgi:phage tail-like protein
MADGTFPFVVSLGNGVRGKFQDLSGIDAEGKPIEYRHGNSPVFYPIKMPGLGRVGNVTMRKGIFVGDTKFWTWYNAIKMNTIGRGNATIDLLDQSGAPKATWTLTDARPTKIAATDRKDDGGDVAIEEIVLAYEGVVISEP